MKNPGSGVVLDVLILDLLPLLTLLQHTFLSDKGVYRPAHTIWGYHTSEQRRLRRICSLEQSMNVDKGIRLALLFMSECVYVNMQ